MMALNVRLDQTGNNIHDLRSVAYSTVELVLLNKHQISGGGAYPDFYRKWCNETGLTDLCVDPYGSRAPPPSPSTYNINPTPSAL